MNNLMNRIWFGVHYTEYGIYPQTYLVFLIPYQEMGAQAVWSWEFLQLITKSF